MSEQNRGNSDEATVTTAWTATVEVEAQILGVTTTTSTAGVTSVEAGEAHRVLMWLRAPPRGNLWSNNQGSGRSSGGGMAREERLAWDGSPTSSRSSSFSSTDNHSEAAVVAGKRCQELWQEEHLGLRLSPSCCVC